MPADKAKADNTPERDSSLTRQATPNAKGQWIPTDDAEIPPASFETCLVWGSG